MPNTARFMHPPSIPRQAVVRRGRRTGRATDVARTDPSNDGPPARARDSAPLSAGSGAAPGPLLLASRDKGNEPVKPAEIVPLGVATFALSKLVAKEKVDKGVREAFADERP